MDSLPVELVVSILSYLQPEDVRRFQRINSRFGEIIKRHEHSRKIPVAITFSKGRVFQTFMHIDSANLSITLIIHSHCEKISVQEPKLHPSLHISTMLNPAYSTFLESVLSTVEIQELSVGAIWDSKVLCEFGRVSMEKNCLIKAIAFTKSQLNQANIEFLRTIRQANGNTILLFNGEPSALVDHDIVHWSSFFKTIFVIHNVNVLPNFLGHLVGSLDRNMVVPGIVEIRSCKAYELERAERLLQKYINSYGTIHGHDGKTLAFEISSVDNAKLVMTYCYAK